MRMIFGGGAQRWIAIGIVSVIGIALGAVAMFVVPERYTATSDVLLTPTQGAATSLPKGSVASLATIAAGPQISSVVEAELGLGEPVGDTLRAEPLPSTSVVRITGIAETAEGAASIAKSGADAFVAWAAAERKGAAKAVTASVVANAVVPDSETYAPRWTWPIGAGLVGALVGFVIPLRRKSPDQLPVSSVDELRSDTSAPVLGVLGHEEDLTALPLISTLPSGHAAAEAIRIVRTNLHFVADEEDVRVLTVTSAVPAEGKSTTCCNLGISLAQTGRTVVILEGDLRRPQLAQYLGVDSSFGVTSVLSNGLDVELAIQHTRVTGLDAVTAGPMPSNPAEVLQTDAMADLIADLRDLYDVVLIDAPPVLPVADAALLAANSDGVLLLAKHGSTGRDQIRAAVERIHAVDGEVVGAVLTMSPRKATQRYGYGYGYGPEVEAPRRAGHRAAR